MRRVVITSQTDHEWQAVLENHEQPIGHGPSEAFAVYDLFMHLAVQEEVSCSTP
jgi:hypothetical protein